MHVSRGWTQSGSSGEGGGQNFILIRLQRNLQAATGSWCINEVAAMLVPLLTRAPPQELEEWSKNVVLLPHFPLMPHPTMSSPTSFVLVASL
jgi:hypothetical protein